MPFVAFDVLAATAPHATRKPAAQSDREGSTQFADMLDKPDSIDQGAPKSQNLTQASDQPKNPDAPVDASAPSKPATEANEPVLAANTTTLPDVTTAQTQPVETNDAAETPVTEQEIRDFLTAVAAATGMKITPVTPSKNDETPAETKSDDKADDATTVTDAAAPADVKSADAAAIVVTAPTDTTASAPEATVTKSAGIAAANTEETVSQAVAADNVAAPAETKDAKPQATAKVEAPVVVTSNLTAEKPAVETKQADTSLHPAAPPQAQKPAADAPAHAAKPAPAQHDVRALDAAPAKSADNVQPMMLVQNQTAVAPAADQPALTPAPPTTPQAVALPVAGIAVEIAGKALAGKNRFEIRLDPPELGRIHVRLDVDHKGEVTSIITADRSDTFDLLRRDAQALERALQDAGVKTANNGLQFSLRDHSAGRHDQPAFTDSARVIVRDDNLDTDIIAPIYRPFTGNRAGVDIRV